MICNLNEKLVFSSFHVVLFPEDNSQFAMIVSLLSNDFQVHDIRALFVGGKGTTLKLKGCSILTKSGSFKNIFKRRIACSWSCKNRFIHFLLLNQ